MSIVLMLIACFAAENPVANAPAATPEPSPWVQQALEHMRGYTITSRTGEVVTEYARIEQPVSQHIQNVRNRSIGSVFIWHDAAGRPVAIVDVFFIPSQGRTLLYDEWHSLTDMSLTARRLGNVRWSPAEPGLDWKVVTDAPTVGEEATRREQQLRQISRRFTARILDRDQQPYELRMLTTPIYRYETPESEECVSGAIFAFCQANDPETLLIIEARKSESGVRWEYAIAEFSNMPQFVQLDGEEVWSADPPQFSSTGKHTGGGLYLVDVQIPNQ